MLIYCFFAFLQKKSLEKNIKNVNYVKKLELSFFSILIIINNHQFVKKNKRLLENHEFESDEPKLGQVFSIYI